MKAGSRWDRARDRRWPSTAWPPDAEANPTTSRCRSPKPKRRRHSHTLEHRAADLAGFGIRWDRSASHVVEDIYDYIDVQGFVEDNVRVAQALEGLFVEVIDV